MTRITQDLDLEVLWHERWSGNRLTSRGEDEAVGGSGERDCATWSDVGLLPFCR